MGAIDERGAGGEATHADENRMRHEPSRDGLCFSSATDIGRLRDRNEDFIGDPKSFELLVGGPRELEERGWLFAVADGMGGHARGEVASRLAVETLFAAFYGGPPGSGDPMERLKRAFSTANSAVYRAGHLVTPDDSDSSSPDVPLSRMGTTLVAAVVMRHTVFIGNVGDSRAYLLEGNRMLQVSEDHSIVAEEVRLGLVGAEEARNLPLRNVITRALGARESVEPDVFWRTWPQEGRLLLCSDGLHGPLKDHIIESTLKKQAPEEAVRRLIDAANEAGGPDNISAIVVAQGTAA